MRGLLVHLSAFVALLVLLNQLSSAATIERTVVVACVTGLAVYVILTVAYAALHHIVEKVPSRPVGEAARPKRSAAHPESGGRSGTKRAEASRA